MLSPCLLVIHDASAGGEDDISELTRREKLNNPFLKITELDVVAWANATSLVDSRTKLIMSGRGDIRLVMALDIPASELDHDLAVAVVVDFFEFANVT